MCDKEVETAKVDSPLGVLILKSCSQGLHRLGREETQTFSPNKDRAVNLIGSKHVPQPIQDTVTWLQEFFLFDTKRMQEVKTPKICHLHVENGPFQVKCWKTLMETVKMGDTISYGELADRCGSPKAARAVGSAMRNNRVMLIIPCHRVIKSDGALGEYSWGGCIVKEWLLNQEKVE